LPQGTGGPPTWPSAESPDERSAAMVSAERMCRARRSVIFLSVAHSGQGCLGLVMGLQNAHTDVPRGFRKTRGRTTADAQPEAFRRLGSRTAAPWCWNATPKPTFTPSLSAQGCKMPGLAVPRRDECWCVHSADARLCPLFRYPLPSVLPCWAPKGDLFAFPAMNYGLSTSESEGCQESTPSRRPS
jgi:hypothetical protein